MANSIIVSNPETGFVWRRELLSNELEDIRKALKGRDAVGGLRALLYPVRTHTLLKCAQDLFVPSTFHVAFRVEAIALKVMAVIFCLFLDGLTLPIRIMTCTPRTLYNADRPRLLVQTLLDIQGACQCILAADQLKVRLVWERPAQHPHSVYTDEKGEVHSTFRTEKHWSEQTINLVEMPLAMSPHDYSSGYSG